MKRFYSYLYLRLDGSPYYVGKGYGKRVYARRSHRIMGPKDIARIVIFPQDSEADAFESEIALIALFGRKDIGTGILRNMTDGGEGATNPSQETRDKISQGLKHYRQQSGDTRRPSHLGYSLSREAKQKIGATWRGKKQPVEMINRRAAFLQGRKRKPYSFSIEGRQKLSKARQGSKNGFFGKKHSEETSRKMKAYWEARFLKTVAWG